MKIQEGCNARIRPDPQCIHEVKMLIECTSAVYAFWILAVGVGVTASRRQRLLERKAGLCWPNSLCKPDLKHTHTHIHIHIHAHAHTHTNPPPPFLSFSLSLSFCLSLSPTDSLTHTHKSTQIHACMYLCMNICVFACMCVCMYVCMYI